MDQLLPISFIEVHHHDPSNTQKAPTMVKIIQNCSCQDSKVQYNATGMKNGTLAYVQKSALNVLVLRHFNEKKLTNPIGATEFILKTHGGCIELNVLLHISLSSKNQRCLLCMVTEPISQKTVDFVALHRGCRLVASIPQKRAQFLHQILLQTDEL